MTYKSYSSGFGSFPNKINNKKHIKEINFDANDMESLCIALNNSDVEEE